MLRSLYSAVSGLDVNQKSMDVIGNNIANVNTIGFKEGRAVFQDLMSQTLIGGKTPTDARGGINPRQVGGGAYLAAVDNIFEPGILKATNRTGDLAIEGNGLFVVRGEGALQRYYTRAGDFNFDRSGSLTNPSGYKVQGWMSDPTTGELNADAGVGDIVLGPQHKILQAKATTKMNMAGVLDTRATSSTLTYQQFLTQAQAQQKLSSMTDSNGRPLDLANGEPVKIKAHATTKTIMSELSDKSGRPLTLGDGNDVTFTFGTTPYSIKYSAAGGSVKGDGLFNTVEEFVEEVNTIFNKVGGAAGPVASMSIKNGMFEITGNSSFELTGIAGNSQLTTMLTPLTGSYGSAITKTSDEVFFVKEVKANENFSNLSELGIQIENAINGSVVADGFNVEFLTNNFGMHEGESITIAGSFNGRAVNFGPFEYTEEENPSSTSNKFHTVQELASKLTRSINTNPDIAAEVAGSGGALTTPQINFGLVGNKMTLSYQGGSPLQMGVSSMSPAPGGQEPNPYLKTILDGSFTTVNAAGVVSGKTIDSIQNTLYVDEIAGKGRLVYNYAQTTNNLKLDMATNDFKMTAGETLSFRIGNADYTVAYGAADDATANPPVFNTATGLANAINTQLGRIVPPAVAPVVATATWNAATGNIEFSVPAGNPDVVISGVSTNATTPYLKEVLNSNLKNKTMIAGDPAVTINGTIVEVPNITGLSIDKSYSGTIFEDNILSTNTVGVNKSISSKQFLTTATENSKVLDLFNAKGESFNFTENETSLNFKASVGGEPVNNNDVFNVQVGTTLKDMMMSMEDFLGLGRDHNSVDNVTLKDGKIVVTGEKGQLNNIDFFNVSGPTSKYAVFNNYMTFESTKASGGYYPTNMSIYDEQGNEHVLNIKFSLWNIEQNEWRVELESDDPLNSIAINGATTNELIMKFNSDGSLAYMYDRFPDPSTIMVNPTVRFSAGNGTNTIPDIALNLGSQGGTDGLVLSAAPAGFTTNSSDGYPQGTIDTTVFNPAGEIVGSYSNGQVRTIGQVAIALFTNQQGLLKVGDSMFAETGNSGQATLGKAQTGSRGDIASGMLENSNVDLSRELVNMITTQRGFQANSKIISTSDEMIQELLSMKR